jgi:outer membrane lipoprotein-sorting protein
MKVMGQERVVTIEKVEHNVALPDDRFALPPEIRALVKK